MKREGKRKGKRKGAGRKDVRKQGGQLLAGKGTAIHHEARTRPRRTRGPSLPLDERPVSRGVGSCTRVAATATGTRSGERKPYSRTWRSGRVEPSTTRPATLPTAELQAVPHVCRLAEVCRASTRRGGQAAVGCGELQAEAQGSMALKLQAHGGAAEPHTLPASHGSLGVWLLRCG